jgi:toxin secretion/phage lysis holin
MLDLNNATHVKNAVLVAIAAVGSFVSGQLGGWDQAMKVLVALMVVDYLTGLLVAAVWHKSNKSDSGTLDSKASFKGLCKKGVVLLLVWLGCLLDSALGETYIRTAIILFFIGNEGLSLLENLGLMGLPYPGFLQKALEALKDQGDSGNGTTN